MPVTLQKILAPQIVASSNHITNWLQEMHLLRQTVIEQAALSLETELAMASEFYPGAETFLQSFLINVIS
jgi:hypothetical protein